MPAIPYIKKKIGHSYLVWFQNSNNYLQLEEPAWFVLRKTAKRCKAETIANEFSDRYAITLDESLTFVNEIRSEISKMNRIDQSAEKLIPNKAAVHAHVFKTFSNRRYKLGEKFLEFAFETPYLESYLHPLISHFETSEQRTKIPLFELFTFQEQVVFRLNGEVKGSWGKDESQFVKGLVFMWLINVLYDKTDADWLMTVHASAITNGKKTILFTAPPNHGKTTIAALLQDRGFRLISDDFVPIDKNSFRAYPFPIAMSVKQTSMDLIASIFPALEEKKLNYISPEKSVRFLPPAVIPDFSKDLFPVHEFIFVNYDSSVDFEWVKAEPLKALKQLLDQAWINPGKNSAEILFEQMNRLSFYQLTYSNNEKALEAITNLFDHD